MTLLAFTEPVYIYGINIVWLTAVPIGLLIFIPMIIDLRRSTKRFIKEAWESEQEFTFDIKHIHFN